MMLHIKRFKEIKFKLSHDKLNNFTQNQNIAITLRLDNCTSFIRKN